MYKNIQRFIAQHQLINPHDIIVVGLSGGPDSLFLLHFLVTLAKEIPLKLIVAHLNHEWRTEAAQEEQLCRDIAHQLNLTYVSTKMSELSLLFKLNGSKEEYARKARRYFFESIAHQYNAHSIALAHHLQDQEETFFIRLIRGSSLAGLTAMKPRNGLYIRPLLETNKQDILNWLHEHTITYAVDTSNESQDYLRNRIRSTVLPALHTCDERFDANFLSTLHNLAATEKFLEQLTRAAFAQISNVVTHSKPSNCARPELVEGYPRALEDILRQAQDERAYYTINIPQFLELNSVLQYRVILHWLIAENVPFPITQAFLDEIIRFFTTPHGGTHLIHQQWKLIKKQNKASLMKL